MGERIRSVANPEESKNAASNVNYNFIDEVLEKPDMASNVGTLFNKYEVKALADALFSAGEQQEAPSFMGERIDKNLQRVHFSVVGVQPNNLFEICQLYCSKCQINFSFKTLQDDSSSTMCHNCKS